MPKYFLYRLSNGAQLVLVETYDERVTPDMISGQYAYDSHPSEVYFLVSAITGKVTARLRVETEKKLVVA